MQRNATTRYPILLVHGLFGFERIGRFELFHDVKQALRDVGNRVFVPQLSATHDNEVRGQQLLMQIDRVLAGTGASKVNVIGHSQGALACRYAAALAPEKVASVTSVSGPNHGSEVADLLRKALVPGQIPERTAHEIATQFANFLTLLSGRRTLPQNAVAALGALTREGVSQFNRTYPQGLPTTWGGQGAEVVDGVRYYSWSGVLPAAPTENLLEFNPVHRVCRVLSRHFTVEAGQNDGFVGRYSSHLGSVIRSDYPFDHMDSLRRTHGPSIDPIELYVEQALRLRAADL
ncbi:esterase/lipase family protein [Pseudomonas sp. EA_5y_Pfl2_R50]|uniref:esterase/lipase family protein n=1 Tax=Pseudomonas sp. EA_5y_Pfl2_R50 TaxID=3088691 RepID=UPI0030D95123